MHHLSDTTIRVATEQTASGGSAPAIQWTIAGAVSDTQRTDADTAISGVLARHRRAVGHTRVRISGASRPGGPALIQVNLRVCGAPARVQISGRTMANAVSAMATRLDRHLARLTTQWQPPQWPDPQRRPLAMADKAAICRLKSFRFHTGMPCQAAAYMNAMDYDVFLYTDAETGEDAIVYRCGPTGVSLARQKTMRPPSMPTLLPFTVNPRKMPTLTPGQAATRLAEHWLPYLFYTDHRTRRGNLLYRRYDGGLGLIAPTESDERS